jgi:predicted nucleic acid-binding protein
VQVVVDADCLIAGTLAATGAASRLLDLWQEGAFELIACPELVGEVRKALLDPRISGRYGITTEEVDALSLRIEEESVFLDDPADPPRVVPDDPGDDYLVALGLSGGCDALITRDRHFAAVAIPGFRILSPRAFLAEVEGVI